MYEYIINLALVACIAALSASALNLLIGYTGVFSAAQAVFYGVGAYIGARVALNYTDDFIIAALAAIVAAVLVSLLLALPAARVSGDYFIVVSLAFEIIGFTIFQQWTAGTGGPEGIIAIPRATLFGTTLETNESYLALAVCCVVIATVILRAIVKSPTGRALTAIRDDPTAARALGKNPFKHRMVAVVISAAISAVGGVIYAGYVSFINADSFTADVSFLYIAMIIFGGAGTITGPLIGAAVITVLPAVLEATAMPPDIKGPVEQMMYGAVLVILMIVRPDGLVGFGKSIKRAIGRRAVRSGGAPAERTDDQISLPEAKVL